MKFIRFCLKTVGVLLVVFLATGLFVKETSYKIDVKIRKQIPSIFEIFSNQNEIPKWNSEVISISSVLEKPGIVGSEYDLLVVNKKDTVTMRKKVIAYVPNKKNTLYSRINNLLKTDDYTFRYIGGMTVITKNVRCESDSYLMLCMLPYMKYYLQEKDQKQLDNFKTYIED